MSGLDAWQHSELSAAAARAGGALAAVPVLDVALLPKVRLPGGGAVGQLAALAWRLAALSWRPHSRLWLSGWGRTCGRETGEGRKDGKGHGRPGGGGWEGRGGLVGGHVALPDVAPPAACRAVAHVEWTCREAHGPGLDTAAARAPCGDAQANRAPRWMACARVPVCARVHARVCFAVCRSPSPRKTRRRSRPSPPTAGNVSPGGVVVHLGSTGHAGDGERGAGPRHIKGARR